MAEGLSAEAGLVQVPVLFAVIAPGKVRASWPPQYDTTTMFPAIRKFLRQTTPDFAALGMMQLQVPVPLRWVEFEDDGQVGPTESGQSALATPD